MAEKLVIAVTFDETRGGYVGTAPELRAPVVALSLGMLRRRAAELIPANSIVILNLDRAARRERDQRRRGGAGPGAWPR
jgi:hypothetical protein